jgi:tRNA threonylcarbamoyl adenosine modification protein YjeE
MTSEGSRRRVLERHLPDERATVRLGEDLAMALRAGDALALSGDLGAGKTTLARGLIRAMAAEENLDVPSPTFTLVQSYGTRVPLNHFDLYRLTSPSELDELGLDEMLATGAALIEWPERAGGRLPKDAVVVELTQDGEARLARIAGSGPAFERISRSLSLRDFMARAGWGEATRRYFTGDASARSYETVTLSGKTRVLMNSPRLVLGPPVRDGKPYAVIAHTAQSVEAFVLLRKAASRFRKSTRKTSTRGFCSSAISARKISSTLPEGRSPRATRLLRSCLRLSTRRNGARGWRRRRAYFTTCRPSTATR